MRFADYSTETVRVNGQRIHLHIAGEGGPLVLLCHGFPESSYSWRHQMNALSAKGYRAVAMDMRGFGRSSKPPAPEDYSIRTVAQDCIEAVDALTEDKAVIVGHDLGAPIAWTAAWMRPDLFSGVVGMSVPFGARGTAGLPGDPFGARRPSEVHREIAGPGLMFYQDYFAQPGRVAELEIEEDLRTWLIAGLYSLSADSPLPPELDGVNLVDLPYEALVEFVRASMCVPNGESFASRLQVPDELPAWVTQDDVDYLVNELERGGIRAPLSYYGAIDLGWEQLAEFEGRPLEVPALFIGGDRDVATIWSQEAARRASEVIKDFRGSVIIPDCGHWIPQERPDVVNRELLDFLDNL